MYERKKGRKKNLIFTDHLHVKVANILIHLIFYNIFFKQVLKGIKRKFLTKITQPIKNKAQNWKLRCLCPPLIFINHHEASLA